MPYRALYLTHRPQTFAALAGQHAVADTLRRAVSGDRVAHAYLFTGPRGTGKTTTARLLAKAINCASVTEGEPDNQCALCLAINDGSALDVIEVDAASNRGIDEIREIRDKVSFAPSQAGKKVYIIDEAHMLTKEAFNALLKTLEEPPDHAVFILATTEPQKVPQTIISRCQRFDFRAPTVPVITEQLTQVATAEKITLDPEAAKLLARHAKGSFRDGLSLLDLLRSVSDDAITADTVRDTLGLADQAAVQELERALAGRDAAAALAVIRTVTEQGTAPETFRLAMIDYLRVLLVASAGGPAPEAAVKLSASWTTAGLLEAVRRFLAATDGAALHPELPLELAALETIASPEDQPVREEQTAPQTPAKPPREPSIPKVDQSDAQVPTAGTAPKAQLPAKAEESSKPAPAADATELWESLLKATKGEYSLSLCLQKTRPAKLDDNTLHLTVQSDFFLKKLEHPATQEKLQEHAKSAAGKDIRLAYQLATQTETDMFEDALSVFAGAKVE